MPAPRTNCALSAATIATSAFDPEPLEGFDLDVTAFVAAVEAISKDGRVDITTHQDGKPAFESVAVGDLNNTLELEPDPVIAVEAAGRAKVIADPVPTADTGEPPPESDPTGPTLPTPVQHSTSATPLAAPSNDPLLAQQWSDQAVPYSPAWKCDRGAGLDIAVIDTGVDRTHPDLSARTTPGGSSLDGAGHVMAGGGGVDPHGHGTHVAGIAAATADNGVGIAGVAPEATIIPVRVLDSSGSGWNVDVAAGITWAADAGAEVINLSLGAPERSDAISNAIAYASSLGVVVVAAAGNGGASGPVEYPGADSRTIAVGSVNSDLTVSGFSTRGSYVDLAAPGAGILSTVPAGGYARFSGTSMATPFVSGVIALMLGTHPTLSPTQVRARLSSTATDAGPAGRDPAYGDGIVNPVRAVGS